ncbi:hypothetical protein FOQG_14586 [Fusarium oxysporum f. sp. raphani 54005]|uniref:Uncharacterized protein n=1 Tax=Fusarium oxysporum f. sp. raphani 54005 TaxID=1089458 RepID=X0BGN1_FUSOX|nr:hypothetical protein FOQG_14586 [Fusarium oxysporum f. sp. raphani 54005]
MQQSLGWTTPFRPRLLKTSFEPQLAFYETRQHFNGGVDCIRPTAGGTMSQDLLEPPDCIMLVWVGFHGLQEI